MGTVRRSGLIGALSVGLGLLLVLVLDHAKARILGDPEMGPKVKSQYFAAPDFNRFSQALNPLLTDFDRISQEIDTVINTIDLNTVPTERIAKTVDDLILRLEHPGSPHRGLAASQRRDPGHVSAIGLRQDESVSRPQRDPTFPQRPRSNRPRRTEWTERVTG